VVFISPEFGSNFNLSLLKNFYKDARFILYMWDSLENKGISCSFVDEFDRVLTFDYADYENNGSLFLYLPLFFISDFDLCTSKSEKYDFVFVGSFTLWRYDVLKRNNFFNSNSYIFLYFKSKLLFRVLSIFSPKFRSIDPSYISFKPISKSDIINLYNQTNAIIDIESETQSGLTMRTIEVLASGTKLITTNPNIKKEWFYDSSTIFVLDDASTDLSIFLNTVNSFDVVPFRAIFSLSAWNDKVFEI
jgi:hypothetical protein